MLGRHSAFCKELMLRGALTILCIVGTRLCRFEVYELLLKRT